jgi:hypothetical protein
MKKKNIKQEDIIDFLNELQERCNGNDELVTMLLAVSLGTHLHSVRDGPMAERVMNYIGGSLNDLFTELRCQEAGTVIPEQVSAALH